MLEISLVVASLVALTLWVAMSAHVLAIQRRRARVQRMLATASDILRSEDGAGLSIANRVARLRPALDAASRETLMRGVTDPDASAQIADGLAAYLVDRWGIDSLERDARSHWSARTKWRRMTALRILTRLAHPGRLQLLARAVEQDDAEIAMVACAELGALNEPEAGDILINALTAGKHPASRIATHLDRSPLRLEMQLRPLLGHADGTVRFWAATLIGSALDVRGLEQALLPLTDDPDPRVRKAAIESLGRVGDALAADAAVRLLADPAPFVRAHAVRALGRLDRVDLAPRAAALLADRNWWVRLAVKQMLEGLGSDVWPILVPLLDHPDRFARNGAAEVFQNLGLLDSLIVMEAASDNPTLQKVEMLRRIAAAGGVRLTDSLLERTGPIIGLRVRGLLSVIGFEKVGAA